MPERILVVEDYLPNAISALLAFKDDKNIEDIIVHGQFEDALEAIDEFKPTIALLDINIRGYGTGRDIGKILRKRNIPYIYVTGVGLDHGIEKDTAKNCNVYAVEIKTENETVARFESKDKDPEVWKAAYEKLRGETK